MYELREDRGTKGTDTNAEGVEGEVNEKGFPLSPADWEVWDPAENDCSAFWAS